MSNKVPSLKSDKRYKDAPRYKLIVEYEREFTKTYEKHIDEILSQIGKQLSKFAK